MQKIIFIFILMQTLIFPTVPHKGLSNYQEKYSQCKGKTDMQISACLLNGNLNYSRFRGDKYSYRTISKEEIQKAARDGNIYHYTMNLLPRTKRYTGLKKYLDYLYSIRKEYIPPQFQGNNEEDIIRI
jgi:hypothetical protein